MKKIFLIILVIINLIFFTGCENNNRTCSQSTVYNNALSSEQMRNDLNFMFKSLHELHPKMKNKDFTKKYNEQIKDIYKEIERPLSKEKFYFIVQKSLAYIKDAHTTVINDDDSILPISLQWVDENLVTINDTDKIKKGSKIIAIGGKNLNKICEQLSQYISSENKFWVRAQMKDLIRRKI